jgi:hypothetical protein
MASTPGEPLDLKVYPYRQLVGSLMHLSVTVRPDITFAVGALARSMAEPTMVHWQAAKGVLRYLSGTASLGITFGGSSGLGLHLQGYCDADYAGDTDTRKSTTGYVFTLNSGAVSWQSKRQPTVAASTTEAEYMAAAAAIKEALWLRKVLNDLQLGPGTISIFADNQSAIKLLRNPLTCCTTLRVSVCSARRCQSPTSAPTACWLTCSPRWSPLPSTRCAARALACCDVHSVVLNVLYAVKCTAACVGVLEMQWSTHSVSCTCCT